MFTINSDLITVSILNFLQNYSKFRMELQNFPSNPSAGLGEGMLASAQCFVALKSKNILL